MIGTAINFLICVLTKRNHELVVVVVVVVVIEARGERATDGMALPDFVQWPQECPHHGGPAAGTDEVSGRPGTA